MTWSCKTPDQAAIRRTPSGFVVHSLSGRRRRALWSMRLLSVLTITVLALSTTPLTMLTGRNLLPHGLYMLVCGVLLAAAMSYAIARMPQGVSLNIDTAAERATISYDRTEQTLPLESVQLTTIQFRHPRHTFGLCDAGLAISAGNNLALVATGTESAMNTLARHLGDRLGVAAAEEHVTIKTNAGGVAFHHPTFTLV
jgi:hypothetical protein